MKKGLLDILKGKFLVSGDAPKNWLFLLFARAIFNDKPKSIVPPVLQIQIHNKPPIKIKQY